jgi:hypothetical protein
MKLIMTAVVFAALTMAGDHHRGAMDVGETPEPASWVMGLTGAVSLGLLARARKNKKGE